MDREPFSNSLLACPLSGTPPPNQRLSSLSSPAARVVVPGGGALQQAPNEIWAAPAPSSIAAAASCWPWGGDAALAPSSITTTVATVAHGA
jgi:hypothetical protein